MFIYVWAALLCCFYASDTVLIAYNYRFYASNPPSSKLLFIAEGLKLAIATSLYLLEAKRDQTQCQQYEPVDGKDSSKYTVLPTAAACGKPSGMLQLCNRLHKCWLTLPEAARSFLTFSVPAVCYFMTNNLSFYALKLMSAHVYTLLCDLKVITTCTLNYLIFDKRLNRQGVTSLCLLFLGISLGHISTLKANGTDNAQGISPDSSNHHHWLLGLSIMILIALLSAIASVYTEWVMNYHQAFCHESINLQNMRLYVVGVLLNGAYYMQSGGLQGKGFLQDMRSSHWAIAVILACMGLVTAVLIKHYGNIVKVYASSVASLLAAWISQTLLHDPPPLLFFLGVGLAAMATLQLQRARSAAPVTEKKPANCQTGKINGWQRLQEWALVITVPVASAAILLLLLVPQAGSYGRLVVRVSAQNAPSYQGLLPGDTTDAPMAVLPPFEPTCFVTHENRVRVQCPVINCSLDMTCTTSNKSCCAYINLHMLTFFDNFLASKGLEGEYALVYGSALGAVRNQTILGHTSDVDLGMTAKALQVLEQNVTREKLWRHGYSFWADQTVWRMCPHQHHPSPDFQALMLPLTAMDHNKQYQLTGAYAGTCFLDAFLMVPVAPDTTDCQSEGLSIVQEPPCAYEAPGDVQQRGDRCHEQSISTGGTGSREHPARMFCVHRGAVPIEVKPYSRPAIVDGFRLPAPEDMPKHVAATYGPNWRCPDTEYHGTVPETPAVYRARKALHEHLSVTAWGDMPWSLRRRRCGLGEESTRS